MKDLNLFKFQLTILVLLAGTIGALDFVFHGTDNPVVWALEGRFAPVLWLSIFSLIIWTLWKIRVKPHTQCKY